MGRHGGGARSGGGGGFHSHSGGGFRSGGGGFHSHSSSPFHHHSNTVFVGSWSSWGGTTQCRGCRLLSWGIFILVVAFIIIVAAARPKSKTNDFQAAAYEYRILDVSTIWYNSVEVNDRSGTYLSTFLLPDKPNPGPTMTREEYHDLNIPAGEYEFYAYRLVPGSAVTITFTMNTDVQFFIVSGEFFEEWSTGDNSDVEYNIYTDNLIGKYFSAGFDDDYYLIWEAPQSLSASGTCNITLDLVTLDVSNSIESCTGYSCIMNLDLGSSQVVVVYAVDTGIPDDVTHGSYTKHARSSVYWGIFGTLTGIFLIAGCIITIAARRAGATTTTTPPETYQMNSPSQPFVTATPVSSPPPPYTAYPINPPPVVPGSDPNPPVVGLEEGVSRGYSSPLPPYTQS